MVKTYVQTVCLREGTEDEYRAYHADCWPAVVRSLADVGVLQMEIFLTPGDPLSRLVMIMKTTDAFDPAVDFPRHASSSPIVVEWEARMKAFQTPAPEAEQGEWWSPVERVFDLSAQLASAGARAGYRVPRDERASHARGESTPSSSLDRSR